MIPFVAALALPLLAATADVPPANTAVDAAAMPQVAPAATVVAPVVTPTDEGANPWITIASGGLGGALGAASFVTVLPLLADTEGSINPSALMIPLGIASATVVGTRLVQQDPTVLNVALPAVGAAAGLATGVTVAFFAAIPLQSIERSPALVYGYFGAASVLGAAAGTALGVVGATAIEE